MGLRQSAVAATLPLPPRDPSGRVDTRPRAAHGSMPPSSASPSPAQPDPVQQRTGAAPGGQTGAKRTSSAPEAGPGDETAAAPEAWVAAMALGNEDGLRRLFRHFGATVQGVAHRLLGDETDASEVTLETFAAAWDRADRFDRSRGPVALWLCMIARSRALDRVRARHSQQDRVGRALQASPDEPVAMSSPSKPPGQLAELSELRGHIVAALAQLPSEQRGAIELAFFGGLSHSEVAERLGVPLGTIKTRIRTGVTRLRDLLAPLYAEDRHT